MATILRYGGYRIGRFSVPAQLVRDFSTDLKRVMGQCIVVKAEHHFHGDQIKYTAVSEHFRETEEGERPPEYSWRFIDDHLVAEEIEVGQKWTDSL